MSDGITYIVLTIFELNYLLSRLIFVKNKWVRNLGFTPFLIQNLIRDKNELICNTLAQKKKENNLLNKRIG